MEIIDFTEAIDQGKLFTYGNKKRIVFTYNNELYLAKISTFTFINENNTLQIKQSYGPIAEYIGCKIYEILGFSVQTVLLGIYKKQNIERIVAACKLFTKPNELIFTEFAEYIEDNKHSISKIPPIENLNKKEDLCDGSNLQDFSILLQDLKLCNCVDNQMLQDFFWGMFIIDAFINIKDRGYGNWGFLTNLNTSEIILAPIYDCESNFFHSFSGDEYLSTILSNNTLINYYALQPLRYPFLVLNNKKISYFNFILSLENEDCNTALKKIAPLIDKNIDKIENMIQDIPFLEDKQKTFFIITLKKRKELLLDLPFITLKFKEQEQECE